jgi:hypothetical protein
MKVFPLSDYYYINDVVKHIDYKDVILTDISMMSIEQSKSDFENISNFDYRRDDTVKRVYEHNFRNLITPYVAELGNKLGFIEYYIHGFWFQQYTKNDFHSWHNHHSCNFSNVYFLELPKGNYATQLYDIQKNKIIEIEGVTEGCLLTFPGHYIHRSPMLESDTRKTIISFNTSFNEVDYKRINENLNE